MIRDSEGCLLAAMNKFYERVADVLAAEAMAARDGLAFAADQGFERVELEVDNQSLSNLLQSKEGEGSSVAGLWQEIRELGRSFRSFEVSLYTGKATRRLTHTPACPWSRTWGSSSFLISLIVCNM